MPRPAALAIDMQSVTIPLVGTYNQRGIDGTGVLAINQDQRFLNCVFKLVTNPITGKSEFYIEKRPGWGVDSTIAAGESSTGLIKPVSLNGTITAFGSTNSTLYYATTSIGTITGVALHFTEIKFSDVTHVMIKSSDGTGWYYVDGAKDNLTYTADGNNSTTITDIKIGGVNSTAGLYVGQKLSAATNIAAGSRISSIDPVAFTAVLDTATTGGAFADLSITKEPIAKIISANFVTTGNYISAFSEMDGFLFYTTDDGNLRNSNLNSVTAYTAMDTLDPNSSPDEPRALVRQGQYIIVLGSASKEVYANPGTNSSGSPLQRVGNTQKIGVLNQRSITSIDDDIYFISSPQEGELGVYRIRGVNAEKVSTPNVDVILGTVGVTNGSFYASSFKLSGYPYAGFFLSSASESAEKLLLESADYLLLESGDKLLLEGNPAQASAFVRFLAYNISLNAWSEWDSQKCTYIDSIGSGTSNQIYATSRTETSGKIYTINPVANGELWRDDGSTYSLEVRTAKVDFGTEARKSINKVTLMGSDIVSASTATLEYSDDDYATWTTAGTFDLSVANPFIMRCGSFQAGRAWRLTHSANTAFRAKALKFDFSIGVH